MTPHTYQLNGVNDLIRFISKGYKKLIFLLPTGGGKTICTAYFLQRYLSRYPDHRIKIIVHREKLAQQLTATLHKFHIHNVQVFMVETFVNQLKKGNYLNTDVMIADEIHIGNFKKVHPLLPNTLFIGFTATALSATKKHPLKSDFEQIVVCSSVRELIELHAEIPTQGLVPAIHYQPENAIVKSEIKMTGGEYNMRSMSDQLSKTKLVDGVLANYVKIGEHQKTIVFNSLCDHSNRVNDCFLSAGYNSMHLDGSMPKEQQAEIFKWFKDTPKAILQSVDMATTGFDEPSIINVIPNRLTMSLPLWLQMCGRGSRPYPGKDYFNIIDPVGNISQHGRWDLKHDWHSIFHYPQKSGTGPPPMKTCPECNAMIYMSATKCEYCGHLFPRETVYSDMVIELKLVPDDLVIPSPTVKKFDKHAAKIAASVKDKPVELNERRDIMEEAVKKLALQSDFKLTNNMITHLASKHL